MLKHLLLKQIILLGTLGLLFSTNSFADSYRKYNKHHNYQHSIHSDRRAGAFYRTDRIVRVEHVPKGYRLDKRYQSNRYYPAPGYRINTLPRDRYVIHFHNRPYYYTSGIWYEHLGGVYVAVRPPIGVVVPILPHFYTTIWFAGIPYYYANNVYYTWQPDRNGYVVTNPPQGLQQDELIPKTDKLFIYPKKGQTEQQQANDKYECHRWGVKQTNYDPSQPPGNLTQEVLAQKREAYQTAMKACLEGRGYSVE